MPPFCLCGVITSVRKPWYSYSTQNKVIYNVFSGSSLGWGHDKAPGAPCGTLSCPRPQHEPLELRVGLIFPEGGYQRAFRLKTCCTWPSFESNKNFWARGHLDDTAQAVFFFLLFYCIWRKGHNILQLYQFWLWICLPLRLQQCFGDSNTSPTSPSA